jgi:hypothetical protein
MTRLRAPSVILGSRARRLVVIPLGGAAAYLALRLIFRDPETTVWVRRIVPTLFLLLAVIGCALAATSLAPGDYLRRAWILLSLDYSALVGTTWLRTLDPTTTVASVRLLLIVALNICQVAAAWRLAQAWRVAGLQLPSRRAPAYVAAILLALVAVGPAVYLGVRDAIQTGQIASWNGLISGLGDGTTFLLMAPIALTAFSLRGGITVWPWLFFTLQILCWLAFDAQDTMILLIMPAATKVPTWLQIAVEPFRIGAAGFAFAAGLSQRWVSGQEVDA